MFGCFKNLRILWLEVH
jgi:hypothetical protein